MPRVWLGWKEEIKSGRLGLKEKNRKGGKEEGIRGEGPMGRKNGGEMREKKTGDWDLGIGDPTRSVH